MKLSSRSVRLVPNRNAGELVAREAGTRALLLHTAEEIASDAARFAPGGQGRYMFAEATTDGARAANSSHFWHLIEYGSVNNPPYSPLRRAVEASGLDYQIF